MTFSREPVAYPCFTDILLMTQYILIKMRGKGSQKEARLNRLKLEIIEYVGDSPGCCAADIVSFLSNERRMRNHGLTTRKIGLFIPRYLANIVGFKLDNSTGKRIYHLATV